MHRAPAPLLGLLCVALMGSGCGAGNRSAFGQLRDNRIEDLQPVIDAMPAARAPQRPENLLGVPLAVAATHAEDEGATSALVALRIDEGTELWRVDFEAATRPEILGDVVLASTREALVAFDLRTGRRLWSNPLSDLGYVGATRAGETIFYAETVGALGGGRREGRIHAVDARDGSGRWREDVNPGVIGQPVARGGYVFVPWERQNIAILDARNGQEVARLRSTDDVVAWMFQDTTGLYYGSRGLYRFNERSASGERPESTYLAPPLGELPRLPETLFEDGFIPRPGGRSARGRIRVHFAPDVANGPAQTPILGETYYFVYFRFVFGFSADGALRWTRTLEEDVIGAQVLPGGLLVAGEQGTLRLLDRTTGNDRFTHETSTALASVAIDAAGFAPSGESGTPRPLRASLNEIILDPDNRLVPARAYAVERLGGLDDPEITRDLLDLYQQRAMPSALKEAIRDTLRTRPTGREHLLAALDRRYDFLDDTLAPPLEAIVPALLEAGASEAVPRLVQHMVDHETPDTVLPDVVRAVVELGRSDAVPALTSFLVLYQADSAFEGPTADQPADEEAGTEARRASPTARALAEAARGIFLHGGEEGRALLAGLSSEASRAHESLAGHVRGLFEEEATSRARQVEDEALAEQRALEEAARQAEVELPRELSQQQVNEAFADHVEQVRACIADELERSPRLAQVRLVFILASDAEGSRASELRVSPNSDALAECLQGHVEAIEFPRFRHRRMRANFTVQIRGGSDESSEEAESHPVPDDAPWWAWSRARANEDDSIPALAAWWAEREPPAPPAPVVAEPSQPVPGQGEEAEPSGPAWWQEAGGDEGDEDAAEQPPAQQPPSQQPPVQQPPAQQPPAQRPPAQRPPAQRPPAQRPPAQRPPVQQPAPPPEEDETPWWEDAEG